MCGCVRATHVFCRRETRCVRACVCVRATHVFCRREARCVRACVCVRATHVFCRRETRCVRACVWVRATHVFCRRETSDAESRLACWSTCPYLVAIVFQTGTCQSWSESAVSNPHTCTCTSCCSAMSMDTLYYENQPNTASASIAPTTLPVIVVTISSLLNSYCN